MHTRRRRRRRRRDRRRDRRLMSRSRLCTFYSELRECCPIRAAFVELEVRRHQLGRGGGGGGGGETSCF